MKTQLLLPGLAMLGLCAHAAEVVTTPGGCLTHSLAATGAGQTGLHYLAVPMDRPLVFSALVSGLSATTLSVTSSPWTASAFSASPHFARLASGAQAGRALRIMANTAGTLTLDTKDNSPQTTALDAAGFSVQSGDRVEIFPARTLASEFGDGSAGNPLKLVGGSNAFTADSVAFYEPLLSRWTGYYFNTLRGRWEISGSLADQSATPLPPGSACLITRRSNRPALALTALGRVPAIPPLLKSEGGNTSTKYASTGFPANLPSSGLALTGWKKNNSAFLADTILVWNAAVARWDAYYQRASDSEWRKQGSSINQNTFVLPAGMGLGLLKRTATSGGTSFLSSTLPYSLQ